VFKIHNITKQPCPQLPGLSLGLWDDALYTFHKNANRNGKYAMLAITPSFRSNRGNCRHLEIGHQAHYENTLLVCQKQRNKSGGA
jgi:hypothetical protein